MTLSHSGRAGCLVSYGVDFYMCFFMICFRRDMCWVLGYERSVCLCFSVADLQNQTLLIMPEIVIGMETWTGETGGTTQKR